jgi:hypothetical protein
LAIHKFWKGAGKSLKTLKCWLFPSGRIAARLVPTTQLNGSPAWLEAAEMLERRLLPRIAAIRLRIPRAHKNAVKGD